MADLTSFCLLDRLGLRFTGQHVGADRTALARRVVEPDDVIQSSFWWIGCDELGASGRGR